MGQGSQECWGPALLTWGPPPELPPLPAASRPLEQTVPTPFCGMLENLLSGCSLGGQREAGQQGLALTWPELIPPHATFQSLCNVTARCPVVGAGYF